MDLGFPEADPARVSNDNVKEWEEERGTLMMRADDDGHDVYGDVIQQADQPESTQSD